MNLQPNDCYRALRARDPRFDGLFFVGVTSTGIYCRPVCHARTPRPDHCQFYPSAAAAERARFRPCLRCRPELAPGQAPVDNLSRTATQAAAMIERGILDNGGGVEQLALQLGISSRQLRRSLKSVLGVSPLQLAQTRRLLLAKQLLNETSLPIIDVAYASGFASLRRFNSLFHTHYGLTPSDLRRTRPSQPVAGLELSLAYRPPLAWDALLHFLAARAIPNVEKITPTSYARTVRIGTCDGWLKVENDPQRSRLIANISTTLLPVLTEVLGRLRRLFDLDAQPMLIQEHLAADPLLAPALMATPGLRLPGAFEDFEIATRAIVGQQVSVRAASTLMHRLTERFGATVLTPIDGLNRAAPTAATLANASPDQMQGIGLTSRRIQTLHLLAQRVASEEIRFAGTTDPEAAIRSLCLLPGIGPWTAQYLAMRVFHWPDAFPAGDLILRRTLGAGSESRTTARAESWRPWRAYGSLYTWHLANMRKDGKDDSLQAGLPDDRLPDRTGDDRLQR